MAIYVYITKQCLQESTRLNKKTQLEAFADRIRNTQRYDYFERFHPPLLKKPIENLRLLAEERQVGEDLVIVFRRLVTRGGHDYIALKASRYQVIPGTNDEEEIQEESLASFIASNQEAPPPPMASPDETELEYLHSVLGSSPDIYRDYHVCETSLWVETMTRDEFANRAMDFNKCVFETIDESRNCISKLHFKDDARFGILFRCFPEWKMVVLLAPFKGNAPDEEVKKRYPQLCGDSVTSKENVIRCARRAYPHALLLTPDAWIQVQKKKEGNMALSEEEIEVLESARTVEGGYPLFINGRAGSGKSTILQYLFAEYVYHTAIKADHEDNRRPVFFACNDELLARCSAGVRAVVAGTFAQNEGSTLIEQGVFEERLAKLSIECFQNFHRWLHSLSKPGDFPDSLRIDYGRFKAWWERNFSRTLSARKLYGPEISWHVIRTYIKGWDVDGYLDAEDYEERAFSTRQNSVTAETYRVVFDTVWKRYHEDQKEKGFWDDQDLARYALENDLIPANHPVVFCDEAQDFTRVELEILHRHSLFSARTVAPYDQPKIPFAFAGDPFQTLNPTGFQWDATRAFFTEKFIKTYPGQTKGEINYQELTFNYRSFAPVVQFCNSLQLARKVLFKLHEIRPQLPWAEEQNSPSVVYFDRSDPDTLKNLKAQSDIRVIIPCEEGGETEWTRQNGLAEHVDFDETGVPKNVASATRVKGLEFPRVVLYGFGDACPASLKHAFTNLDRQLEGDGAIELQYYLNRLYVAASRPMKRLFIIDSDEAIQNFWMKIFSSQDDMMMRIKETADWEDKCGQILHGKASSWHGDEEKPRDTAETLQKDASLRKDPYLYRQAAQYYASANSPQLAAECKSEALELEGKYLESAESWRALERYDRSLMAAWKAGRQADDFINQLADQRPDLKQRIHVRFASHFKEDKGLNGWAVLLKDFLEALSESTLRDEVVTEPSWKVAIQDCLDRLQKINDKAEALWHVCYSRVLQLDPLGLRLPSRVLGSLAYKAGRMTDAYDHWKNSTSDQRQGIESEFLRAKAATVAFPDNIEVYGDLLRRDESRTVAEEIIKLINDKPGYAPTLIQREVLLRTALILMDWDRVFDHLRFAKNEDLVIQVLTKLAEQPGLTYDSLSRKALRKWYEILAEQGRWRDIHQLVAQRQIPTRNIENLSKSSKLGKWIAKNSRVVGNILTDFLADTSLFSEARNDEKSLFANYLRDHFTLDFSWAQEIHPMRVGQAFEKAGLFKETLPFYEGVFANLSFSEDLIRLARVRWARTKFEQGKREAENSPKRAEKIEEEVLAFIRKHMISATELERPFPIELPPVERAAESVEELGNTLTQTTPVADAISTKNTASYARQMNFGNFEIRIGSNGHRVNFQHQETDQQAFIIVSKLEARLDGELVPLDSSGQFDFQTWGLKARIDVTKQRIYIETSDGAEISLPVNVTT